MYCSILRWVGESGLDGSTGGAATYLLADRLRRVFTIVFPCSLPFAVICAATVVICSRDPVASCRHNAPADLTDEQASLSTSTDDLRGGLRCIWSGLQGTNARHLTLRIYRWPINADDWATAVLRRTTSTESRTASAMLRIDQCGAT